MNKIVLEHYPVEKLPDDLKAAVGHEGRVTLTIERERSPLDRDALVAQLREEKKRMTAEQGRTLAEIVAEVRSLRDEWDD
ncbi:hypothetical protein VE25_10240 [Devosia geojensis]|uniref:Uncharacterized protein n=1 Tax=Devosia geojensis TaxID=443610 RepID=A0A0F5FSS1_9HYPH|nr:hypothetical protein [Devosia geojensis]KKB11921.1 hypothetical protein VE25_10240 [Devosia geojensis]